MANENENENSTADQNPAIKYPDGKNEIDNNAANQCNTADQNPAIKYPDGSVLLRPQELSGPFLIVLALLVVVAIIIGYFMVTTVSSKVIYASDSAKAEISTIVNSSKTADYPVLPQYLGYDDEGLIIALQNAGYTMTWIPQTNDSANSVDVAKLTERSASLDVAAFYTNDGSGFSNLDKVKILNDSWRLTLNRQSGYVLRLRYADFTSATVEDAISTAMAKQGFSAESATDLATDDSKNTYREGVVISGDSTLRWRVSAIDITEVYTISNLPQDAYYVGVRLQEE